MRCKPTPLKKQCNMHKLECTIVGTTLARLQWLTLLCEMIQQRFTQAVAPKNLPQSFLTQPGLTRSWSKSWTRRCADGDIFMDGYVSSKMVKMVRFERTFNFDFDNTNPDLVQRLIGETQTCRVKVYMFTMYCWRIRMLWFFLPWLAKKRRNVLLRYDVWWKVL